MANTKDNQSEYDTEIENNTRIFKDLVKRIRPDIFVLMDLLDNTHINPIVVFKIIRQLNNLALGNKYGTVTITMENGVILFVRGEESDRINVPLLVEPVS